jgi:hypothetical protein
VLATPASSLFLDGVNRLDRRLFFLEVVGVELGVGPSLLFSLSSLLTTAGVEAKTFVSLEGTANLPSELDPREAAEL